MSSKQEVNTPIKEHASSVETLTKGEQSRHQNKEPRTHKPGHKKKHAPDVPKQKIKETKHDEVKEIDEPMYAAVIPKEMRKPSNQTSHVTVNNDGEKSTNVLRINYRRKSSSSSTSSSDTEHKRIDTKTEASNKGHKVSHDLHNITKIDLSHKSHHETQKETIEKTFYAPFNPYKEELEISLKNKYKENTFSPKEQDKQNTQSQSASIFKIGGSKSKEPVKSSKENVHKGKKNLEKPKKSRRESIFDFVRRRKHHGHSDSSNSDNSDKEHSMQTEHLLQTKAEIENKKLVAQGKNGSKGNLTMEKDSKTKNSSNDISEVSHQQVTQKKSKPEKISEKGVGKSALAKTIYVSSNDNLKPETSKGLPNLKKQIRKSNSCSSSNSDDQIKTELKKLESPKFMLKIETPDKIKKSETKSFSSEKTECADTKKNQKPVIIIKHDTRDDINDKPASSLARNSKYNETKLTKVAGEKSYTSLSDTSSDDDDKSTTKKDTLKSQTLDVKDQPQFSMSNPEIFAKIKKIDNIQYENVKSGVADIAPTRSKTSLKGYDSSSSDSSREEKVLKIRKTNPLKENISSTKIMNTDNNISGDHKMNKIKADTKKRDDKETFPKIPPFQVIKPKIVHTVSLSLQGTDNDSNVKHKNNVHKEAEATDVSPSYIKSESHNKQKSTIAAKPTSTDAKIKKTSKSKHKSDSTSENDSGSNSDTKLQTHMSTKQQIRAKQKVDVPLFSHKKKGTNTSSDSSSEDDFKQKSEVELETHKEEPKYSVFGAKKNQETKKDKSVESHEIKFNKLEDPKHDLKHIGKIINSTATLAEESSKRYPKPNPTLTSKSSSEEEINIKPPIPIILKELIGSNTTINEDLKKIDNEIEIKPAFIVTHNAQNSTDLKIKSTNTTLFPNLKSGNYSTVLQEVYSSESDRDSESLEKKYHGKLKKSPASGSVLPIHAKSESDIITSSNTRKDKGEIKTALALNQVIYDTKTPIEKLETYSTCDNSLKTTSTLSTSSESSSDEEKNKRKLLGGNIKPIYSKSVGVDSMSAVSKVIESYKKNAKLESIQNLPHEESVQINLPLNAVTPKQVSHSAEIKPPWIDEGFISIALKYYLGPYEYIKCLQIEPAVALGENYSSDVFRAMVKTDSRTIHIILKCIPQVELRAKFFKQAKLSVRESAVYMHALPLLKGQSDTPKYPRCYHTLQDNIRDTMVLEDLKPLGYKTSPRQKGLDVEHCRLALTELAHLHGFSAALRKLDPKKFHNELVNKYSELLYTEEQEAFFGPFFTSIFTGLVTAIRDNLPLRYHFAADLLQTIIPRIYSILKKSVTCNNGIIVFHHGDFWNNNILFRYSKNNNHPLACSLIDFQLSRVASPVLELLYFFYSSTEQNVRKESEEELLKIYLNEVHWAMYQRGVENPEGVFYTTMEDLRKDMRKYAIFGFLTACALMPIIVANEEDVPDMNEYLEENMQNINSIEKMVKGSIFKRRMRHIIEDFDDMGLFSDIKNNKILC